MSGSAGQNSGSLTVMVATGGCATERGNGVDGGL
jgi:hypothetical protein